MIYYQININVINISLSDRNVQNSNNGDSGSDDLNNDNGQ